MGKDVAGSVAGVLNVEEPEVTEPGSVKGDAVYGEGHVDQEFHELPAS